MSTIRIIVGSAFEVPEPIEGNVRNYTGAGGSHWLGYDTSDVLYTCSRSCYETVVHESFPFVTGFGTSWVDDQHPHFDRELNTFAETIDIDNDDQFEFDYPDYDVCCANEACGELIHQASFEGFDHDDESEEDDDDDE